jgi:hypothetical protein
MGQFSKYVTGRTIEPSEEQPEPQQNDAAPTEPPSFRKYVTGRPTTQPAAKVGKPFGELRADDPTPTEKYVTRPMQDMFIAAGASPYTAGKLATGGTAVASAMPILGSILSGADLSYDVPRGNWLAAGADAAGIYFPLARLGGRTLRSIKHEVPFMTRYAPSVPKDRIAEMLAERKRAVAEAGSETPTVDRLSRFIPGNPVTGGGISTFVGQHMGFDPVTSLAFGAVAAPAIKGGVTAAAGVGEKTFRLLQARKAAELAYQQRIANMPSRLDRPALTSDMLRYTLPPQLREPAREIDDYGHTPYEER